MSKTVTRQRRDCNLNPDPSAPESSTLTTRLFEPPFVVGYFSIKKESWTSDFASVQCCLAVSQFEYMPRCEICAATWQVTLSMRFFASPAPGRCVQTCVIHKIRSTQRITTPPEEDYKPRPSVACTKKWMKTGHVVACGQTDRPNRQTRLSQYVASQPVRSNNSVSQKLKLLQENILSYYTGVYDFSVN